MAKSPFASPRPQSEEPTHYNGVPVRRQEDLRHVPIEEWTAEEMLATLPYCHDCMSGPWEVYFREPGTGFGWRGMEPCPHGHIYTAERARMVADEVTVREVLFSSTITAIGAHEAHEWTKAGMPEVPGLNPLMYLSYFFVLFQVHRFRKVMSRIERLLSYDDTIGHLPGLWFPHQKGMQPWMRYP